ncbi:hypothetical protein DDB_G0284377 [Dictyostelium discoideum AX4]|uniref:Lysosomal dipeptide transporter MFSD1 n=1 Tax=Dictyostelium discoideum TaxID=44689 RepID=Q54PQ9_DICDI|nr:hypothetical protein DDB_G0284377 [Dictyostelium discoideum AX4]EAL65237.1 hypothetical protein DDB_G0284377 [Dictyostelium discoideum AX4]|eukprot:XP_638595.1 hypothetical protein DDB_G0284377 [Dictyostelium discoideum AX4]
MLSSSSSSLSNNEEINIRNSNNNKIPKDLLKSSSSGLNFCNNNNSNNIFIVKSDDLLNSPISTTPPIIQNNNNNNNSNNINNNKNENNNSSNNKNENENENKSESENKITKNSNGNGSYYYYYSVNTILDDTNNENNENNENSENNNNKNNNEEYGNINNENDFNYYNINNNNNKDNFSDNNIIILKDSNNIEMDYIDLNISNKILKKSLSFLHNNNNNNNNNNNDQNTTTQIKLKLLSIFSIKTFKTIFLVFLISNLGYSTFFSYTSPEALSHTFYETFSISSSQFSGLFILYALPNVFMVILSGMIIDMVGADIVSIVLSSCVVISTLVGALSPPNFPLMLVSRFILGFAGESLISCSNTIMSKWFHSRTLSLCMGVLVGWIYSANFISLTILPSIKKRLGFKLSLWIIFFIALLGLSLNILYLLIKNNFNDIKQYQSNEEKDKLLNNYNINNNINNNNNNNNIIIIGDINNNKVNNNEDDKEVLLNINNNNNNNNNNKILKLIINFKDKVKSILIQVPIRMWLIVGIVFFGYTALFGLAIIGPDFLGQKYGFNESRAALILSSEHIVSATFSPIVGILIKRFTKRILVLLISLVIMIIGLTLLLTTNVYPLWWIVICGIGYSMLNTTIVSSIPIIAPQSIIGTCYGFIGTSYNCGLIVFPYLLGSLKESFGNYNISITILIGNCIISILLLCLLKYFDLKESILNKRLDN